MTPHDRAQKFINILKSNQHVAYDVETGGQTPGDGAPLDWKRGYVCGYSVSDGKDKVYVPVRHSSNNLDNPELFEFDINRTVSEKKDYIVGHSLKFDMHFSANHGIYLGDRVADTMIDAALLNENKFSYSLENTCKEYYIPQKKSKEIKSYIASKFNTTEKDAMGHFYRLPGNDPIGSDYAEFDTYSTYHLHEAQRQKLTNQNLDVVSKLERKLIYVLWRMERRGVKVDQEELAKIQTKIDQLHLDAYNLVPLKEDLSPINVRSNKDLQDYFKMCEVFDWPMTEPTDRFPDGQPSFNKNFLGLSTEGAIILNARKYSTFKSMFLEPFPAHIFNGKIHARFNQAVGELGGAKPGRLSCGDPNMQFIPKRDKYLGRLFRKAFVPSDPKYVYVELDYSQAEPCLFTHYSGEPVLLEGYSATPRIDMHAIAAEYMDIARDTAKNLNLGMMYAMGASKLAIQLGISYNDALLIIRRWHKTFPRVSAFTKAAAKRAEEKGFVFTILGRRARFTNPNYSYRAANRIVQGGSADIIKYKMVEIENCIINDGLEDEIRMLLTIHDSLLFEINKDRIEFCIEYIKSKMEALQCEPFNLKVPFKVDYKYGKDWSVATYGEEIHEKKHN